MNYSPLEEVLTPAQRVAFLKSLSYRLNALADHESTAEHTKWSFDEHLTAYYVAEDSGCSQKD